MMDNFNKSELYAKPIIEEQSFADFVRVITRFALEDFFDEHSNIFQNDLE
jgi:hypothetical protein